MINFITPDKARDKRKEALRSKYLWISTRINSAADEGSRSIFISHEDIKENNCESQKIYSFIKEEGFDATIENGGVLKGVIISWK
jgi:hypothetical protein